MRYWEWIPLLFLFYMLKHPGTQLPFVACLSIRSQSRLLLRIFIGQYILWWQHIVFALITLKFCTCHNSNAVVACAKFPCDEINEIWIRCYKKNIIIEDFVIMKHWKYGAPGRATLEIVGLRVMSLEVLWCDAGSRRRGITVLWQVSSTVLMGCSASAETRWGQIHWSLLWLGMGNFCHHFVTDTCISCYNLFFEMVSDWLRFFSIRCWFHSYRCWLIQFQLM